MHEPTVFVLCLVVGMGLTAVASGQAAEPEEGPIVVLSYNIHYGRGMDEDIDLERVARVIRETGADVVALQEVDRRTRRSGGVDQAAALAEMLEMEHAFGRAIDYQGGAYGNAVLSHLSIEGVTNVALPQAEAGEARAAIAASVQGPGGRAFTFISTHLDHRSEENRLVQIEAINERFANGEHPTLLMGDMNAEPDSPELGRLTEWWVRACGADASPTFRSDDPRVRIDYVLARPAERWEAVDATVVDEPMASDHRPVRVVLRLAE